MHQGGSGSARLWHASVRQTEVRLPRQSSEEFDGTKSEMAGGRVGPAPSSKPPGLGEGGENPVVRPVEGRRPSVGRPSQVVCQCLSSRRPCCPTAGSADRRPLILPSAR